jgi:DNA repair protein RecN (Recombination protein N)
MLKFLRIRQLATIEDIRLDLDDGFTVLTGETGAGKSIIIDSIRLVCGDKGSPDLVRAGSAEASVEAVFTPPAGSAGDGDLFSPGDDEIVLQRQVPREGNGKAYCGGVLVPVRRLKELAPRLAEIYGQNDHIFLLRLESHLEYLDQTGGLTGPAQETAEAARELRRLARLKAEWTAKERERGQRLDFLSFQIQEIEKAALKPGEEEELRSQRHVLKNAEKILGLADQALELAYSGETSIHGLMARLEHVLAEFAPFDAEMAATGESLIPFRIVIGELADRLMKIRNRGDLSPETLERVEERLSLIEGLKRKYGADIRDIQFYLDGLRKERDDLAGIRETLARVDADIARARTAFETTAGALSKARIRAARSLEKTIEAEIAQLGMQKARFEIRVAPTPAAEIEAERVRDSGIDDVEFLIAPNPGEPPKPLRRIASGGELSRIMLALKAQGREKEPPKTLIFDEIDSGIGGKTAEFVARKLQDLARVHQVICITHLPQIASFASHHFRIEKTVAADRTYTSVRPLGFEERVEEVARLMAGSRLTEASRASALDMLRHNMAAEKPRKARTDEEKRK